MKKHAIIFALSAGILLTLCGGTTSAIVASAEEEAPRENGPVVTTQVDYNGNDVEITVEYWNGNYYLADYTRNIYMHNGSTVTSEQDMHLNPDGYPIYSSKDGKFRDPITISAYYNLCKAYDYYNEANIGFDWPGVNGKNDDVHGNSAARRGVELPLHVFMHTNFGTYRYNAAFSHQQYFNHCIVFMGDGSEWNGSANMQHQGAALDVLAHEYQHGVTEFYSKGLAYDGESGALNEAFSDMIALIVEGKEKNLTPDNERFWIMGEDAVSVNGKYIRSIANPEDGFRDTYKNRYVCNKHRYHDLSCDYGGVHYNSTILTHLQYTACKRLPGFFNYDNLAKLWLRTLNTIPANANFTEFQKKFLSAAADLNFPEEAQQVLIESFRESGFSDLLKVTFKNDDGTIIATSYVADGERPTAPANPQKAHTDNVRYEFTGWDKPIAAVHEDTVITASYKEIAIYVVRFMDGAGGVFEEQTVDIGKKAKRPLGSPTKEPTEGKRYRFDKWDYDFGEVTGNIEVQPIFEETNIYKVRFLNGDGTVMSEQDIDEGKAATAPKEEPTKEQDEHCRYTFSGLWDKDFSSVHENLEVRPIFDETHLFTIQFVDADGNFLTDEYVLEEGESVEAPEPPRKASDSQFSYSFTGWDGIYTDVHESAVIAPLYTPKLRTYSVIYYVDGKIINADDAKADYGTSLMSLPKGYEGWYTDEEFTKPFELSYVNGNLRLYAKKQTSNLGLYIGLGVGGAAIIAIAAVAAVVIVKKKHANGNTPAEGE